MNKTKNMVYDKTYVHIQNTINKINRLAIKWEERLMCNVWLVYKLFLNATEINLEDYPIEK